MLNGEGKSRLGECNPCPLALKTRNFGEICDMMKLVQRKNERIRHYLFMPERQQIIKECRKPDRNGFRWIFTNLVPRFQ